MSAHCLLETFDMVYGLDRAALSIIDDATADDLLRLASLVLVWQREIDRRLVEERRQNGSLS